MHKDKDDPVGLHRQRDLTAFDHTPMDGEMFLQVGIKAFQAILPSNAFNCVVSVL